MSRGVLPTRFCWTGLVLLCLGCGSGVYEQRFQNTQMFYSRIALRNSQLTAPAWNDRGGVALQIPKGFAEIEDVKPEKPQAEGEGEAPVEPAPEDVPDEDERQPRMLNVILPGMRGAFQQTGAYNYLFVLSSRGIKRPEGVAETVIEQLGTNPAVFNSDLCKILRDTIGIPEFDYSKTVTQQFPASKQPFVNPVQYKTAVLFHPQQLPDGRTVDWKISLYLFEGREPDVQVALLAVEPKATAGSFSTAMDLALETLDVNTNAFRSEEGGQGGTIGGGL